MLYYIEITGWANVNEQLLHQMSYQLMGHRPCTRQHRNQQKSHDFRCCKRGRCNAHMPKPWQPVTDPDKDSFAFYRRRHTMGETTMPTPKKPYTRKTNPGAKDWVKFTNQWYLFYYLHNHQNHIYFLC